MMMVMEMQTREDIPNAAIKQPCHASGFAWAANTACAPLGSGQHMYRHSEGGRGEERERDFDLAYYWVTLRRRRDKGGQPASRPAARDLATYPRTVTICRGEQRA